MLFIRCSHLTLTVICIAFLNVETDPLYFALFQEWYGTQTLRSLLSLDEEGIDLQSALALRNHLEAVGQGHQ